MPDWGEVLKEVQQEISAGNKAAVDTVRRKYLAQLYAYTERNVIAYYSGFLSKQDISGLDINDEDKNGFMMAVHNLDRTQGLDLILHTPGGDIAATQSLVFYLRQMFGNNIRAIVPQIAMSAGTILACSCQSIVMAKHSNLGPIDPHVGGRPAYGILQEFRRAYREVKRDASKAPLWHAIISQYRPTLLSQCENAIHWSNAFVKEQLETVMFDGEASASNKATAIVRKLTDYRGNKTHTRHIHYDECVGMGLKIEILENDPNWQDLVLTVHHCFMHSLMNTPSYKMIENHLGAAFIKRQLVAQVMIPPGGPSLMPSP